MSVGIRSANVFSLKTNTKEISDPCKGRKTQATKSGSYCLLKVSKWKLS